MVGTKHTLVEHEALDGVVVTACVSDTKLFDKIEAHGGALYDTMQEADAVADRINEKYAADGGIVPDLLNGAHMSGFTKKVRVSGQRLYIPIRTGPGTS
ncbi:hypothetical protein ACIGXM_14675 [Kitasatospora sp. NPDC052896]|uniref:hypothetical protein n=1 Tax=Kitasatospora sp. NPDC052896 TaxID=3364061 RepID=UPI0037C83CC9